MTKSKCCQAEMKVHSGDEGTNFYICTECNEPCDAISIMNNRFEEPKVVYSMTPEVMEQIERQAEARGIERAAKIVEQVYNDVLSEIKLTDDYASLITLNRCIQKLKSLLPTNNQSEDE